MSAREAALNAVLGDYFEQRGSALAIQMAFYDGGRPLELSAAALHAAHSRLTSRLVVLVPGMAKTESCWAFTNDSALSYGTLLRDELGFTPFYLRYNTGLHVSQNGRALAALLEQLVAAYPGSIEEITLIGHSMGGLVIRSACHYAAEAAVSWLHRARRAFYLGTPHLGSPFEKAGHLASLVLGAIPHPIVKLTGAVGNLRSAGIKDLRHGSLVDEDWRGRDLDAFDAARPRSIPLHADIEHYLIAGALTQSEKHVFTRLFGDALVRLPSASAPGHQAGLPSRHFAVLPGVHHMQLAHSPAVYETIRSCIGESMSEHAAAAPVTAGARALNANSERRFERIDAYRALLEDAVHHGATAVQEVQEALTRRPYDVIACIPPLGAPANAARSLHIAAVRGVYSTIRAVNSVTAAVLHVGFDWLAKADDEPRR